MNEKKLKFILNKVDLKEDTDKISEILKNSNDLTEKKEALLIAAVYNLSREDGDKIKEIYKIIRNINKAELAMRNPGAVSRQRVMAIRDKYFLEGIPSRLLMNIVGLMLNYKIPIDIAMFVVM